MPNSRFSSDSLPAAPSHVLPDPLRAMTPGGHIVDSIPLGGIVTVRDRLLARQAAGHKVYRLESGDPSFSIPDHVRRAIQKALDDGHTHYTPGAGIKPLREAVARKLLETNGIPVQSPDHVLITNGAMHGLYVAFRALCEPGDEVIVPDPTWTETADNVTLAGGNPVRVRLDASNGYGYPPEAIAEAITARTRAIVVNSPHNPTGLVMSESDLRAVLAVAERHGLWVLSDEAYEHVLFDGARHRSAHSLGYDRVLSVFSMSKSYAMSGLRLGYLSCNDDRLLERMTKLLRCTINGVNSATQYGAIAALTGPQEMTLEMAAEYQRRRDVLWEGLRGIQALEPFKPSGAFYLWARIADSFPRYGARPGGWAMTEYLIDRAGIGSAPGEVFGPAGAGHVRFAFSCSTDQVVAAAALLREVLG
jgi:aspartate/methionine/tyrosine aminotransferase